jgi:GR25 family glycosyltransferase involved in LPS biosynthesis
MNYAGFCINLDRRPDRWALMEAELEKHGLKGAYKRFSAIQGNGLKLSNPHITEGEIGCYSSHYMLLKENLGQTKPLHIIEDDILFARSAAQVINGVIEQKLFADCDIIYTDVFIPIQTAAYKAYKKFYDATSVKDDQGNISHNAFSIFDLKNIPFGSTSSYLVNPSSIQKLHDLYAEAITHEPRQSNDLFIRDMSTQGVLKVGCLFPFVTSVSLDEIVDTDIIRSYHQASALAAHMARYAFFVDADFDKCQEYINKYLALPPTTDKITKILNHLLAFSLTDQYRSF